LAALIGALPKAFAVDATALPTGADVRHGSATVGTEGATMTINQSTSRATINWQSFNVGTDARVNVVQNDSQSVLLNRVVGNEMSQIRGQISANGQVVLVNPNGIVMGSTGRITASAFTATTFGITDANFEAGHMKYERNGSNGQIVHQGHIQTAEAGGYVALIGADVNNQGTITTRQGAVVLAAADAVTLPNVSAINNVSVPLSRNVRLEINPAAFGSASVSNSGVIQTEGGQVLLRAAAVVDAVSKVASATVVQSGSIDTTGAQGGGVDILADHGRIRVSGSVKANSTDGSAGGDVYIGRDKDTNVLAAVGDVRGAKLESLGGFIETSGDYLSTRNIQVKAKDWLLDPTNIRIVESGTTTTASSNTGGAYGTTTFQDSEAISNSLVYRDDIQNAINAGTSVTIDTANSTLGANGSGNITIETALSFVNNTTNAATLSLLAKNGITQNSGASITNTGSGLVHVVMVAEGLPGGVAIAAGTNNTSSNGITLNSTIKTNGDVTITGTSANNAQHGVRFSNGSGIDARSYNVTGRMTASSGGSQGGAQGSGVVFTNTSVFKSTADSTITASTSSTGSADVFGMHFHNGSNVSFDTGNAKLVAATDAANMGRGVKIGWAGGAVINTRGDVTLGSLNANAFTHVQGKINAQGGNLTLLGRSASDGVQFQDGGGVGPEIIGTQGANITIKGESSGGGTGVNTNRSNWGTTVISTSGTSSANTAGNISITGTSASGTGIFNSGAGGSNITNTSTGTSTKGGIKLVGTSNAGNNHGINSSGLVTAAGLVEMVGTAKGNRAGVRVGAIVIGPNVTVANVTGGSVDIYGSSAGGVGVDIAAIVKSTDTSTSAAGVTLTGFGGNTWGGDNQGVYVRAAGAVDSASKVSIVGRNTVFANTSTLIGVASRMIVRPFYKQMRMRSVPVFHGPHRCFAFER
jgi:filamentous hemagglutinin family protein